MRKHNTLKEQLERHPAFLNRKTQNYEEAKLIYKSNISSLKIPCFFFLKLDKLNLSSNGKITNTARISLKRKNNDGELLPQ